MCVSQCPAGAVPAVIQDSAGHACLLVLPSDKPSNRKEAVAVEELLAALLQVRDLTLSGTDEPTNESRGLLWQQGAAPFEQAQQQEGDSGNGAAASSSSAFKQGFCGCSVRTQKHLQLHTSALSESPFCVRAHYISSRAKDDQAERHLNASG
jgi:hypothetical protein